MSGLEPLASGAPVLVAGGGVTGKAVLAALSRFGAVPTLCDDDPATLRGYADAGWRPRRRRWPPSRSPATPWW